MRTGAERPAAIRRVLLLAAIAAAPGIHGCRPAQAEATPAPRYSVTAQGRIDAAGETRALIAERDGVIRRMLVRAGQPVRAGEVLVELSCDDVAAMGAAARARAAEAAASLGLVREGPRAEEITAARAALAGTDAALKDAADQLSRSKALAQAGYFPVRDLEAVRHAHQAARSRHDETRSRLEALERGSRPGELKLAESRLRGAEAEVAAQAAARAKCTIRSPVDGRVLRVLRREGEASGASQLSPVLTVGDISKVMVRAEIDERDAMSVKVGDVAEVWADDPAVRHRGRVVETALQMGRKTVLSPDPADRSDRDIREVFVQLDDPKAPRLVGLRVTVGMLRGS